MKYDTLIISGGSVKGYAFLGSFKYLLDNEIIKLKEIKHIISASVGALMSLPILMGVNINMISKIMLNTDINLYDEKKFNIKNLFDYYGIYENSELEKYATIFCRYFLNKDNISLIDLYKKTKIKFTVKVSNITENKTEYINYLNYPDLDLVTLIKMTTCVPLFFKPVLYNNCLYCDGATGGALPIEYNKSKNYLAIYLTLLKNSDVVDNVFTYMYRLYNIYSFENDLNMYKKKKNIINIDLYEPLKLEITNKEKNKYFYEGYTQTEKYFNDLK